MSSRAFEINEFLQRELRPRQLGEVAAVEAARWLDASGLLKDSASRSGLPLRNKLRAGEIDAAIQRPTGSRGRWFIGRANQAGNDRARGVSVDVPLRATRGNHPEDDAKIRARRRRDQAAKKYRPASVRLLLVPEAPPSALDRYFYFATVATQDSLFRYVTRAILKVEPTRANRTPRGRARPSGFCRALTRIAASWPASSRSRPASPPATGRRWASWRSS